MGRGEIYVGLGKIMADGNWAADVDYTIWSDEQPRAWLALLRGDLIGSLDTGNLVLLSPTGAYYQILEGYSIDKLGRYVVGVAPLVQWH